MRTVEYLQVVVVSVTMAVTVGPSRRPFAIRLRGHVCGPQVYVCVCIRVFPHARAVLDFSVMYSEYDVMLGLDAA